MQERFQRIESLFEGALFKNAVDLFVETAKGLEDDEFIELGVSFVSRYNLLDQRLMRGLRSDDDLNEWAYQFQRCFLTFRNKHLREDNVFKNHLMWLIMFRNETQMRINQLMTTFTEELESAVLSLIDELRNLKTQILRLITAYQSAQC